MFALPTTCRLGRRLYFINISIKAIQDRLEQTFRFKLQPPRFVSKSSMAPANLCPVNLPANTPGSL